MNSIAKSSQDVAREMAASLLSMPLGLVPLHLEGVLASLVEGIRCENIPTGIIFRGIETLRNGTLRIYCKNGEQFIIPNWEKEAIETAKSLARFHDLEKLHVGEVRQMIQTKIFDLPGNGKISV